MKQRTYDAIINNISTFNTQVLLKWLKNLLRFSWRFGVWFFISSIIIYIFKDNLMESYLITKLFFIFSIPMMLTLFQIILEYSQHVRKKIYEENKLRYFWLFLGYRDSFKIDSENVHRDNIRSWCQNNLTNLFRINSSDYYQGNSKYYYLNITCLKKKDLVFIKMSLATLV